MCLALPMKLLERDEISGVVEIGGVQRSVSLMLLPEAAVGDHLLVHAGYAIATVDAAEAAETLRMYEQMRAAEAAEAAGAADAWAMPGTTEREKHP